MTGPISFGNDRSIGSGATGTQLDIHAGKVDIRMIPENAVGNDISKCVNIRDTGTGELYPIATATPPQEFDLPLAEGVNIIANHPALFWKNQFCEVTVVVSATKSAPFSDVEVIATLPEGFRPQNTMIFPCVASDTRNSGFLYVYSSGEIRVSFGENSEKCAIACFSFVAAPSTKSLR